MPQGELTVWPVSGLQRVFPLDRAPASAARQAATGWGLAGAGGEYLTCQLGVRFAGRLHDLVLEATPLRAAKGGGELAAPVVRWVGLVPVPSDAFWPAGAERPDYVPGWYPDPLLPTPPWHDTAPVRAAAIHLTVQVPRGTPAGDYRGELRVLAKEKDQAPELRATVPLTLRAWGFDLPARPTFHVTNWYQPDCVTKHHRCAPWSERHWRLLDAYAREMGTHRQDVITTPTLIGNFHNSDPMTLVDATRRRDGTYSFDLTRLERWVKLFDAHGFALYEMWHLAAQAHGETAPPFGLFDEAKGERVWLDQLRTDSPEYRALIGAFLDTLAAWLDARGWSERFLLHVFDEPRRECWPRYKELSAFFRQHAPKLKHIDAVSTSDLITTTGADLDIPVPLTPHLTDDQYYRERAQAGQAPVWWYTCCGPAGKFANRFVAQPPLTTRILPWQAHVYGISGFLHWGYNFWHHTGQNASGWAGVNGYADHLLVNPYREHPNRWAVGDAAIVYPPAEWWTEAGPVSSLRNEALREGLQDYELLRLAAAAVAAAPTGVRKAQATAKAQALLAQVAGPLCGSLTEFTRDAKLLLRTRRQLGDALGVLLR